jgi:hypothetical protein
MAMEGFNTYKQMRVIGHTVNREEFLAALGYYACYIFVKDLFILALNQTLACLNGENNLDVDLGVSVRHARIMK